MYRKEIFNMNVNGRIREGMAYLMNRDGISPPSPMYYNAIKKGYGFRVKSAPTDLTATATR